MLSARDLAQLKTDVQIALVDICSIVSKTASSDGQGGQSFSTNTTTNVACLVVSPTKAEESDIGGVFQGKPVVTFLFATATTVSINDTIVHSTGQYEVVDTDPRTNKVTKRTVCVRVR